MRLLTLRVPRDGLWQELQSSVSPQGPHAVQAQGCRLGIPRAAAAPATMLQRLAALRRKESLNLPAALVNDLVDANDTLVVAVEQERAELLMNCIARAGSNHALTFNWKKVEVMPIRCHASILKPHGCEIPSKSSLVYLGSTLSASGDIISEVNRKPGMARADFTALDRVWKHSSLTSRSKLRVFNACVVSKLLSCLHSAWLNKAELRRLDAFQTSCPDP